MFIIIPKVGSKRCGSLGRGRPLSLALDLLLGSSFLDSNVDDLPIEILSRLSNSGLAGHEAGRKSKGVYSRSNARVTHLSMCKY